MSVTKLLDRASKAYYDGVPFMSDAEFDVLATNNDYSAVGAKSTDNKVKHMFQMYSLAKVYDDEEYNVSGNDWVETPKLDGAAVEVTYINGHLAVAATRGDGVRGQDITDKIALLVPDIISGDTPTQIVGEVVVKDKSIENSRNYAAGALNLKDIEEFKNRIPNLEFIAYNTQDNASDVDTYENDMVYLWELGFSTVCHIKEGHTYPTDGTVFRVNSNKEFNELGFTAKHPRGAYARKLSSDVSVVETELLDVVWQVGSSGKVTPVAEFVEVNIDDANVSRATLHNPGFIEDMQLSIGDTLLVTRSGGVIPKVLGKV